MRIFTVVNEEGRVLIETCSYGIAKDESDQYNRVIGRKWCVIYVREEKHDHSSVKSRN